MHKTEVNNFSHKATPFATVIVTVDGDSHITTKMSTKGTSDVTMFFNSVEEITQFATDLLIQAAKELKEVK